MDIDDTLWENNIFFLASLKWLCGIGRECGHTDRATERLLNQWENFNIHAKGFGYNSYEHSLLMALRMLAVRAGRENDHAGWHSQGLRWTRFLRNHPITWMPGVLETLPVLTQNFKTIIVTKGNWLDQIAKVHRSKLGHLFHAAEVVPHKYPGCYLGLLSKYNLRAEETVMVGNSPRSDINMAKRAGLRTVYVPHPKTWFREVEPIRPDGPATIEVPSFDRILSVISAD